MNVEGTVTKDLLNTQTVSPQPNNPLTWASGIESSIYYDNRLMPSFPGKRTVIVRGFVGLIKREYVEAEVVIGIMATGIPWGAMVVDKLEKPFGYMRGSNRNHGRGNKIERRIRQGARAVVVEGLVPTGGSARDVIESLCEVGAGVLGVAVIFTYLLSASTELFRSVSCEFKTLSNHNVLIDVTSEHAYIKDGDLEKLKAWKQDLEDESWTEKWNREHNTLGHRMQQVFYTLLMEAATVRTCRRSYVKKRLLIPGDGGVYEGCSFGVDHYQVGELVFNTEMGGYQEVLFDLSYCGQIVMMTYPMVGNYGINRDDFESLNPAVLGFVVKEYYVQPSSLRCDLTLDELLKLEEISGVCHVDARAVTRKLRSGDTTCAIMADANADVDAMVKLLKETDFLHDQVVRVSTQKPFPIPTHGKKVVLMDFGTKHGIIRGLSHRSCDLVIVPYNISTQAILALHLSGIMLSNGSGDPKDMTGAIKEIRKPIKHVPVSGICLGHQLTSLVCGANTVKLEFGYRGCNHPVLNLSSGKAEITSQNHGYAMEAESLANIDLIMTHQALNDKSVEGARHKRYSVFNIQYHPGAASGPEDVNYLFDQFIKLMEKKNVQNDKAYRYEKNTCDRVRTNCHRSGSGI